MTIAGMTVPGDIPIPVVLRYNAAYASEGHQVSEWTALTNDEGNTYYGYAPTMAGLDRGIFATIHFGFVTAGATERIPNTGTGTKTDIFVPIQYYVLEDGSQYAASDFGSFATLVGGTFDLAASFGLSNKAAGSVLVDSSGKLATYTATLAELGTWSGQAATLASGVSTFTVVMDRDRARIYAPLGANSAWVPILWLDRFGHSVTFSYKTFTTGMPSGITDVRTVKVLNSRGNGVQLQWAEPASTSTSQILARVDYIGAQAPSIQIEGFADLATLIPTGCGGSSSQAMKPV